MKCSPTHHKASVGGDTVGDCLYPAVREEDAENDIILRPRLYCIEAKTVLPVLTLHSSPIAGLLLVEIVPDVVLHGVPVPVQGGISISGLVWSISIIECD